jgi:hypothetical protein
MGRLWFTLIGTGAEDRATQGCDLSADFRGQTISGDERTSPVLTFRNKTYMGWQDRGKSQGVWGTASPM